MAGKGLAICGVLFLLLGSSSYSLAMNQELTNATAFSETIYVDDNNTEGPWDGSIEHPYQHIQDGIDNASAGDTVFIFAGYYFEKINITKTLNLFGENRTTTIISYVNGGFNNSALILSADDMVSAVTLLADDIVLSHFTINLTQDYLLGIIIKSVSGCKIEDNIFKSDWGIHLDQSSYNEVCNNLFQTLSCGLRIGWYDNASASFNDVHDNVFTNTGESYAISGIWLQKTAFKNTISNNFFTNCKQKGIYSYNSKNNVIKENIIIGNNGSWGIAMGWIDEPAYEGNIIRNNYIQWCEVGIWSETDGHIIEDNTIINTTEGLCLVFGPRDILVRNNTIKGCDTGQSTWYADRGVIFDGNRYEHNRFGIIIHNSNNLTYINNTIKDNEIGMLAGWSSSCSVTRNNFLNNTIDAFMFFSKCEFRKNYWDRPRILPKPIFGILPFIRFDLTPALKPS